MHPELRHLRYFVTVAQSLHFGRAAQQLGITQPVLSDQIKRLETLLGVKLLHLTKRVVQLTKPGEVLLKESIQLLFQAETAFDNVQRSAKGEIGQLSIGYTGPALYTVMPEIVRAFRDRYPQVSLTLHERCTPDQETALLNGDIQVGFLHPPIDTPLQLISILREPMVLALPENHPLAAQAKVSIRDLADESFILFPRSVGPNLYANILKLCASAGFTPDIVQEVTPQPTMVGMVAAGIGIALVSASMKQIHRSGVAYCEMEEVGPVLELAIAWNLANKGNNSLSKASESPMLQNFLAIADNWCKRTNTLEKP